MSVKPILFNTEMVKTILDGRKSCTRRLVKLPKHIEVDGNGTYTLYAEETVYENQHMEELELYIKKPYQVGDILYVRETWQNVFETEWDDEERKEVNIRDMISNFDEIDKICVGLSSEWSTPTMQPRNKYFIYKADDIRFADSENGLRWHPSLHMPKEAARIFLKVTDVRVERLQNIDKYWSNYDKEGMRNPKFENISITMKERFISVWEGTFKKSDIDFYGWNANPWVWVIEFERCEKPQGDKK